MDSASNFVCFPKASPMALRLVRNAFDDPAFLVELKHDGFGAVCYVENGNCRLVSRNLRNLRFESLQKKLAKLPVEDAVLDGRTENLI